MRGMGGGDGSNILPLKHDLFFDSTWCYFDGPAFDFVCSAVANLFITSTFAMNQQPTSDRPLSISKAMFRPLVRKIQSRPTVRPFPAGYSKTTSERE